MSQLHVAARLGWLLCAAALANAAEVAVPALEARVTDLTGTLTAAEQASLESKLADFEARKGAQIAVLVVPTTEPEAIEQYSIRVVDQWQLGRKASDDGLLLLIAKDDKRMRIEVGQGLEGAVTDLYSRRIIADTIAPLFKQGDFYGGINAGLDQLIRLIDGEALPAPDNEWHPQSSILDHLPFLLVAVFVGSMILRTIFGRAFGSLLTGGATGGLVFFVSQLLGLSVGAGIAAFLFSLLLGFSGAGRWSSLPRHGGWGGGGWGGGGWGGGGSAGGGFSGGGGGFSGGGASGSW
ncbi:MAG: YgcG family protein [Steroidobacteraceae bacterium]